MTKYSCFLLLFLFITINCYSSVNDSVLHRIQKQSIHSSLLNENREYWVYTPKSYQEYTQQHYPVVYLLDADINMGLFIGIHDFLTKGALAVCPEMIVVGVCNTNRTRDLTPTHMDDRADGGLQKGGSYKLSGGAEKFVDFIKNELMPEVNKKYRTMNYRLFAGHSFGGLTVISTLLTHPGYFDAYLAIDPSLWWDNEVMLAKADAALKNSQLRGKQLLMTSAAKNTMPGQDTTLEHPGATARFAKTIEASELIFLYKNWEDEEHGTISLPSLYTGLKFVFDGYQSNRRVIKQPNLLAEGFKRFSEKRGVAFTPPEYVVDAFAQLCMSSGDTDNGLAFLKLNTSNYPQSKHAWNSLADGCMKAGLKQEAAIFRKNAFGKK